LGSITGVVADSAGTPIAGAAVTSGSVSSKSDDAGRYGLTMLAPGKYTITVIARGFETGHAGATVTDGGTTTVNFRLAKAATGAIGGNVSDDDGPLGATVTAETVWAVFRPTRIPTVITHCPAFPPGRHKSRQPRAVTRHNSNRHRWLAAKPYAWISSC